MLERLLERISISKYKHSFILKGGMLIAAIVGIDTRTTMDLDVTIKGRTLVETEITAIMNEILNVTIDDCVVFNFKGIEKIREGVDYPGYRISIEALLDKTRQMLKVDITTGDLVTPSEIEYNFRLMFEERLIPVMAYNLETVLAEKFETIITRGLTNIRMRDFYDIYILTTTQSFDREVFHRALKKTTMKRNTVEQMIHTEDVIQRVATSDIMIGLWQRYQKKYSYANDVSWDMMIDSLVMLGLRWQNNTLQRESK